MTLKPFTGRGLLVALAVFSGSSAGAKNVEIAPFAGIQFAGSLASAYGSRFTLSDGLDYGMTANHRVAPGWRVELLYSRQTTELTNRSVETRFKLSVERYLAAIQEEKGDGRVRYIGDFLMGVTRFAPGFSGFDSDVRFTLGLSLGIKTWLTPRVGVRAEGRTFLVVTQAGGSALCGNGTCLFRYVANGLWQGDLSGSLVLGF
jgi:hypothetical protein